MSIRQLSVTAIILSFIFALAIPATAQTKQPWSGPGFEASAADLLKAANEIQKTKGYEATVLIDDITLSVDAAGRMTLRSRTVFRPDTEDAVQRWAGINVGWEPWHQKQPEVRARIITTDGVEHILDPKTLSDAPAHQGDAALYSDTRVYRGPLPAVAVGAIVEEEVVVEDTEPVFAGGLVRKQYLGRSVPVFESRLLIEVPDSAPLKYEVRLLPDAKVTKTVENGKTRILVEQGRLDAIDMMDTFLPPEMADWPQVEFSTAASWKQLADTYRTLSEPQIHLDEVAQVVNETILPKDSRDEKIGKLTARLHKDIRYTGVEFGRLKIVPQPPAEVFKRKYGDCKDKATTLVAMLRAAKIPAYLALLNSAGQDVSPSLPGGNLFDHVIVFVPGKPDLWIDATDEYSSPGHLPLGDQGRYALQIKDGTTDLVRTPTATGLDNLVLEKREYRLAEFGPATIVEESESHGFTDRSYRYRYGTADDSNKRQKELEDYTKNVYLADGETKVTTGDGRDLTKPFLFRIETTKARRGYTSLRDARAALFVGSISERLPDYFRRTDEDLKKEDEKREKPRKARTADFMLPAPFVTE